jgi:hypothetical protein
MTNTQLLISTKKLNPITTENSFRNWTDTPLTTDLNDYFDWLSENYGISKALNPHQSMTTPSIPRKNTINSFFYLVFFPQ